MDKIIGRLEYWSTYKASKSLRKEQKINIEPPSLETFIENARQRRETQQMQYEIGNEK